jgi:hypothetical protein
LHHHPGGDFASVPVPEVLVARRHEMPRRRFSLATGGCRPRAILNIFVACRALPPTGSNQPEIALARVRAVAWTASFQWKRWSPFGGIHGITVVASGSG